MKKNLKLKLRSETIRVLTAQSLRGANGGQIHLSLDEDSCRPYSNGTPTCTTCTIGSSNQYTYCVNECANGTEG